MTTTSVDLLQLWNQSDNVIRGVAIILLLMSVLSWLVIALKVLWILRVQQTRKKINKIVEADNPIHLYTSQNQQENFILYDPIVKSGFQAIQRYEHFDGTIEKSDWLLASMKSSIDQNLDAMQRGLSSLATIGAIAPFIGLFGTVYGIYLALMTISAQGKSDIASVSGPIGEALIMTAVGLVVAIPAVIFYNIFTRFNKKLLGSLKRFAQDIYPYLLSFQ